ncbi:MAG TPA: SGNH/GDSL hydrolase family protein [Rubricoccaceae bacterium]|jgi:hypothetical protein
MSHLVLLGDSILDNGSYVRPGEPDVVAQVRQALPAGWSATLLAVDGSVVADVPHQLAALPAGATHLVLSVGGNDALGAVGVLDAPVRSVGEALDRLTATVDRFEARYDALIRATVRTGLPLTVCTVYNGHFPDPAFQRRAQAALALFNDAILRSAFAANVRVVDLRRVCTEPEDYANPIEPSARGGEKMARVLVRAVTDAGVPGSAVYP